MKSSVKNIQLTSLEDLFLTEEEIVDKDREKVQDIPLDKLIPFTNHPFKVVDDDQMESMVASIQRHGVLVPALARPLPRTESENARQVGEEYEAYELIAGHRRKRASALAGKTTMPVLVREMDDDEAIIAMVNSNIQRENLYPSEKAWAYKMKLDAIRRKAGRPTKENPRQVGENYSVNILSEHSTDSARNIHRYIRLTELVSDLLQMVDNKKLSFTPAVMVSYLKPEEQMQLLDVMDEQMVIPSLKQAKSLKEYSLHGRLDESTIRAILTQDFAPSLQITLKKEQLQQYFPQDYTQQQMESIILSLLENWKANHT